MIANNIKSDHENKNNCDNNIKVIVGMLHGRLIINIPYAACWNTSSHVWQQQDDFGNKLLNS